MDVRRLLGSVWGKVAVVVGILVGAIATAVGTGLGNDWMDALRGEQVISASSEEEIYGCGTTLFFPARSVREILGQPPPDQMDWSDFKAQFGGAAAPFGSVLVSIQGETSRPITLTAISISEVTRKRRPHGATFQNPCGGPLTGRQIVFDLDRAGWPVVESSENPEAIVGAGDSEGRPYKPIRLPWTVSLEDPLLLRILVRTKRCDCTWSAAINWHSGERHGQIRIDNGGDGYEVVGLTGLRRADHYITQTHADVLWSRYHPRKGWLGTP